MQLIFQFEMFVKICHFSVTNIKLFVYVQPEGALFSAAYVY